MAHATKIDKQGRIIIPKELREKLRLRPETSLKIHIMGRKLVIEAYDPDLESNVKNWEQKLKNMIIEPFKIDQPDETSEAKWFSEQYARQKLGL
ncbi:MAG: AbrB/MazE/SpoVT family DNA-binding domain-containing protein [Candidatus Heimdallarchaeota archaeon]